MKQVYKTNAQFLKEAKKINDQYKKENDGQSLFTPKMEQVLEHLCENMKEMPDHLINAELNKILKPIKE